MTARSVLTAGALAGAAVVALAACSTDDSHSTSSHGSAASTAAPAAEEAVAEGVSAACEALAQNARLTADPTSPAYASLLSQRIPLMETVAAEVPEAAEPANSVAAAFQEAIDLNDPMLAQDPNVFADEAALGEWANSSCGYDTLAVSAEEHEYSGLPDTAAAGSYSIALENKSEDFHMMVIGKLPDTFTGTAEDISTMPVPEVLGMTTEMFAGAHAMNGETGYLMADLSPGKYAVLCPVISPDEHESHYALGMVQIVTVA
jgi:hypothetical protein